MSNIEMKVDALCALVMSETESERVSARNTLRELLENPCQNTKPSRKDEIERILLDLGVADNLTGYTYLKRAIEIAIEHATTVHNVTTVLYPRIAESFGTTRSCVERAIRGAIEASWLRCDYETQKKYFGNMVSPQKGKPTNGEFIARIANLLR